MPTAIPSTAATIGVRVRASWRMKASAGEVLKPSSALSPDAWRMKSARSLPALNMPGCPAKTTAPTASDGELGAASDSPPAAQTRDWIATFPKGPRSYSRPPLPWPADAEFDARNPPNTPYGRKVNTSGVYAALSNGTVKKMTRSIFNKWGDLHAMTFIEKSPYEGLTQDNMGEP